MNSGIAVPKRIKVGFSKRKDTYTGMLAYVIYYDEKGKIRKETSWENWRDKSIEPKEYNNIPISGFILNKKAGDYGNGWDHRRAYCRVYDPRGFEIEITFENLIYILEFVDCCRGKGLQGDFVYGWDGKDLVLVPVCSPDYKQIAEFNDKKNSGVTIKPKEVTVGKTYIDKKNNKLTYLGQFDFYELHTILRNTKTGEEQCGEYYWGRYNTADFEKQVESLEDWVQSKKSIHAGKKHVFVENYASKNKHYIFRWYATINGKFVEQNGEISQQDVDKLIIELHKREEFSPIQTVTINEYSKSEFKRKMGDPYSVHYYSKRVVSPDGLEVNVTFTKCKDPVVPFEDIVFKVTPLKFSICIEAPISYTAVQEKFKEKFRDKISMSLNHHRGYELYASMTFDELYEIMKPCKLTTNLASGAVQYVHDSCT